MLTYRQLTANNNLFNNCWLLHKGGFVKRLIGFLVICGGFVLAEQKQSTFKVTVICPDAAGLAPTTATYTITAPNMESLAGKAIAQFKQDHSAHRSHKQGIYDIKAVQ
jgi:hypothetical protein